MFKYNIGDRIIYNDKPCKVIGRTHNDFLNDEGKIVDTYNYTVKSEETDKQYFLNEKDLKKATKYHIVITEDGKEIVNKDIDANKIRHLARPKSFVYTEGVDIIDDYIFCK